MKKDNNINSEELNKKGNCEIAPQTVGFGEDLIFIMDEDGISDMHKILNSFNKILKNQTAEKD
ncbi:MAG: hypothetical protein ACD_59C00046G0002 [uncultured bacterium]|nr:MAG: hypothetical protein ACD_59C00046G0002 [uncultured bacterium]